MSENLNRRSAWGALAGLPALAILPGAGSALASTAPLVHPDAALFAKQSVIETADRELDATLDALEAAADAYSNKEPAAPAAPSGPGFSAEEQQALDAFAAKLRAGRERGRPPEWVAYEHAIQDYEREVERQKAEYGVTAADELEDAVHETISQARADWVDASARTLAGLIFKARYAAARYRAEYDEG